jgi:hypothetical protein
LRRRSWKIRVFDQHLRCAAQLFADQALRVFFARSSHLAAPARYSSILDAIVVCPSPMPVPHRGAAKGKFSEKGIDQTV